MNITTITCTSDRPSAFTLCEKYLARQTVQPFQSLVLDDGEIPTECTLGQDYHYFPECRGRGSMVNKVKRAIEGKLIKGDAIAFVEDDDWYAPDYLAWMQRGLEKFSLYGEGRALYYTVRGRYWFEHVNLSHSSLCSTGIRVDGFDWLLKQVKISECPFLDVRLWNRAPISRKVSDPYREPGGRRVIGIKAMPGRSGYGGGHRGRDRSAVDDPDLSKLRSLIGDDADAYAKFYDPASVERFVEKNGYTAPVAPKMNAKQFYDQYRMKNPRIL